MQDNSNLWGASETKHFHHLGPEEVLQVIDTWGMRTTGRVLALNSLENRVYDVEVASKLDFGKEFSSTSLIIKFYRPGRWSKEQILEEHEFLNTLKAHEVPVVPPLEFQKKTLHLDEKTHLYYALFPKVMGRLKDELIGDEIDQVGRLIGRIHNLGSMKTFTHRLRLHPDTFIKSNKALLLTHPPLEYGAFNHYVSLLDQIHTLLSFKFQHLKFQRLHGDFHRGNIVWTTSGPVAVDFDDSLMGPIEQDLWPLFAGRDPDSKKDRERFLSAYQEMTREFEIKLSLTETLRTMRMIHFNAWIAKRWEDHSFKRTFPQFMTPQYWDQEFLELRSQMSLVQESFDLGY